MGGELVQLQDLQGVLFLRVGFEAASVNYRKSARADRLYDLVLILDVVFAVEEELRLPLLLLFYAGEL